MPQIQKHPSAYGIVSAASVFFLVSAGCATNQPAVDAVAVHDAIHHYASALVDSRTTCSNPDSNSSTITHRRPSACFSKNTISENNLTMPVFTLAVMPDDDTPTTASQPAEDLPDAVLGIPKEYWRQDLWHQMGNEAKAFGTDNLWRGFKTSFWDLENALLLTAAMGASVTIRETGVDDTIRSRIYGHNQLGDAREVIQVLGNPATHFAGAGILWLTSTLNEDVEQHEVAKSLAEALTVTGMTTLGLKFTAGTREPDGDKYGWPSGHTASSVAVAAVLNEHYGPLVGLPCFALAGLVGYERLDSREHDLSDVVFGAVLGYVVGTSVARDQKAQFPELWGMTVVPFTDIETGANGIALMKSW